MENKIRRAKASMFSLSEEDIRKMIDASENIRDRIVVELLAYTGARRGEIIRIKLSHLDLENDRIFIPTLKRKNDPESELRPVPIIDSRLKQDLKVYLELWYAKYELNKKKRLIQQQQVTSKDGITPCRINQIIKDTALKAGISCPNINRKNVHPHLFRHSFIRFSRKYGLDFKIIQEIAGHKDISTTFSMYGMPSWEEIRDETREKMANYTKIKEGE